jgi:hypothetical protein
MIDDMAEFEAGPYPVKQIFDSVDAELDVDACID